MESRLQRAINFYCSMLPNLRAESATDTKRLYEIAYEAHKSSDEEVTLQNLIDGLKVNDHFEATDEEIETIATARLKENKHAKEILYYLREYIK